MHFYEPQEAKWSVFKEKKEISLCMTCAYHMNEILVKYQKCYVHVPSITCEWDAK